MEFTHEIVNDILVVHVKGNNLDASRSYEFKDEIKDLLDETKHYNLAIDLSDVQFIDSSGLGCLIAALRLAHQGNGEVRLCGMCKQVKSVFDLVSLNKLFQSYTTTDEAVQSFKVPV